MPLNGLLLVDKPSGITSHDVVHKVRRTLGQSSVGHSGTLDPLASGLMILLLGQATKLSDYILTQDKTYDVTLRLGVRTDSGDRTGQVIAELPVEVSEEQVREVLNGLTGDLNLKVPVYSAIKIKGKKLYEYARAEQTVTVPEKLMRFYDLTGVKFQSPLIKVTVSCSKGSYIRSWVEAIGEKLGCGATVEELRRVFTAPFGVGAAVTLEQLAADGPGQAFIPIAQALPNWTTCSVKGKEERLLRNGQIAFDLMNRLIAAQKKAHLDQAPVGIKVLGEGGDLVGLLEAAPAQGLKIRRIFTIDPESHSH